MFGVNAAQYQNIDIRVGNLAISSQWRFVQGIIPYGAQLLMAAGLASVSPVQIIPYLYYPFIMGLCALLAIVLRYPRSVAGVR